VHVCQASGWTVVLARVPASGKACKQVLSCHKAWSIPSDLRIAELGLHCTLSSHRRHNMNMEAKITQAAFPGSFPDHYK